MKRILLFALTLLPIYTTQAQFASTDSDLKYILGENIDIVNDEWPEDDCFPEHVLYYYDGNPTVSTSFMVTFGLITGQGLVANNDVWAPFLNDYFQIKVSYVNGTIEEKHLPATIGSYIDVNSTLPHYLIFEKDPIEIEMITYGIVSMANCQVVDQLCDFQTAYDAGGFIESYIGVDVSSIQCDQSSASPCPFNQNIIGTVQNQDVTLSTLNLTTAEVLAVATTNNVENISFLITDAANQAQPVTLDFYDSSWPVIDVENWNYTLIGFAQYSDLLIQTIITYDNGSQEFCPDLVYLEMVNNSQVCDILGLLIPSFDLGTLTFNYEDSENSAYLINELSSMGLSYAQAEGIIQQEINYAQFTLSYSNGGAYSTQTYLLTNVANLTLSDLEVFYENISDVNFTGSLLIEYFHSNGSASSCLIYPIDLVEEPGTSNDLPDYACGEAYAPPVITNQTDLAVANVGDIFTIEGMAFSIADVTQSNNTFSGIGHLANSFMDKPIMVSFSQIRVNDEYQVYDGFILGVEGDPHEMPEFNIQPDTFNFGGEICLPPESIIEGYDENGFGTADGLDDRGFGQDSIHHITGTYYDENGFDINGNNEETGGLYSLAGCDMYGFDEEGNLCEDDGVEAYVNEFVDSVSTTLQTEVDQLIVDLTDLISDSLLMLDCQTLIADINAKIQDLDFDRKFIVGETNQYLDEGMSEKFSSEPMPMVTQTSERDIRVKDLESLHIELYRCDKTKRALEGISSAVANLGAEGIKDLLLERMQNLTRYQVDKFKADPDAFRAWMIHTINLIIDEANGITYVPPVRHSNLPKTNQQMDYSSPYFNMASTDNAMLFNYTPKPMEEEKWLYTQGFSTIKGIDRGYYIEEVYNQMSFMGGSSDNYTMLPARLEKLIDGISYNIYLTELKVEAGIGATLDAYFIFRDPGSDKKMIFSATDLSFGTGGILGNGQLSLNTMIELRLSNSALLRIMPGPETFVTWDCSGFTGMSIDLEIELCRNLIVPLDPETLLPEPDSVRYKINALTSLANWSDFYLELNNQDTLQPFAMAKYEDLKWKLSNMVVDFSDYQSPTNLSLPESYCSPHFQNNQFLNSWRGFYLGNLEVILPDHLANDPENQTIGVNDVVIDGQGVSASLYAENLIDISTGSLAGWAYSVDRFELLVLKNHVAGGGLGGEINVPVLKGNMDYNAMIYPENYYEFTITPPASDSFPMLLGAVEIYDNSFIQVKYHNDDFLAKATLHGEIDVKTNGGLSLDFPKITFQNFEIFSEKPYFSPGVWGMSNEFGASFMGFGVNLSNLKTFSPTETEAGVSLDVDLTLSDAIGINAGGAIDVIGRYEEDILGRQKWVYDRIEVEQFKIDAQFSAGHVKGYLERFEDNSLYGNGFRGFVDMEFKALGKVQALALFGKSTYQSTDPYKYFFVDAMAELSGPGLSTGALSIYGLAGGVSHHMNPVYGPLSISNYNISGGMPAIGESLSGVIYTPDMSKGLGFKAGSLLGLTGKKEIFNGLATFGMLFNSEQDGGGLEEMNFEGIGQFMSSVTIPGLPEDPDTLVAPTIDASLKAHLRLYYNFDKSEFKGSLSTFLDTPGHFLTGAGDNYKMVNTELYFGPSDWFVYIGTPSNRCGINVGLPYIGNVTLNSYLDVGTDVPNMPDLPSKVRSIAYKVAKNQTFRNSGAGFVFGAEFDVDAHMNFGIASGSLDAGLGFDLMVRKFNNAYCLGNQPYEQIGINGWYALGQMWAYMEGSISILGVNVLKAGIAAILQAQLPNPFFAQATVGVRIKLLFATIRKSFKLSIGDRCTIVSNGEDGVGVEVISYINPQTGAEEITVDYIPEVFFNLPVNKTFELYELDGSLSDFKAEVRETSLSSFLIGELEHDFVMSDENTSAKLMPHGMFYEGDTVTLTIIVDVFKNGTLIKTEEQSVTFSTGEAYKNIPESNIEYTYPIDGMKNFYKDEYNHYKGYIQMKSGMPELFYSIPEGMEQKVRLTRNNGTIHVFNFDYDPITRRVSFPIHPEWYENEVMYSLEIVTLEKGSYEGYVAGTGADFDMWEDGSATELLGTAYEADPFDEANEDSSTQPDQVLFQMYFGVSKYNTFIEKMDAIGSGVTDVVFSNDATSLYKTLQADVEVLDYYELHFNDFEPPLIRMSYNFETYWFNVYKDKLYNQQMPIALQNVFCDQIIDYRDNGHPHPEQAFKVITHGSLTGLKIDNEVFKYGYQTVPENIHKPLAPLSQKLKFYAAKVIRDDVMNIQTDIELCITEDQEFWLFENIDNESPYPVPTTNFDDILNLNLSDIPNGEYRIRLEYIIPGDVATTSPYYLTLTK